MTLAREVLEERRGQSLTRVGPREKKRGGMDKSLAKFCYKERKGKRERRLFYSWEERQAACVPADGDDRGRWESGWSNVPGWARAGSRAQEERAGASAGWGRSVKGEGKAGFSGPEAGRWVRW